ncbi:hypothetical protein [Aquimarina sp. 2201CG5-10]|uniref:hypothetical protein n=1 Tax=Aquimarina callyspongiae TaxID=3098150 RepID=UPI002AB3BEE6|nr:hypothetical protein [Aquimarina sp. 2201CG5-10]MDY8135940.1 hypothetical protein [Aquimarina sp. 2201CG5-10]
MTNEILFMYILNPLYSNSIGTAFTLEDVDGQINPKVQLCIGDIAILMDNQEIKTLLTVIQSVQKGCNCENCDCEKSSKTIKCKTPDVELKLNFTPDKLKALEEFVLGVLFHNDYSNLLSVNDIGPNNPF